MTIAANGNGLISSKLTTYEKPPEWAKYPDFFPFKLSKIYKLLSQF